MDYSPFNPYIWLIFFGFILITYLTVKAVHAMYPGYPQGDTEEDKEASG
jgi:hypothetical protein